MKLEIEVGEKSLEAVEGIGDFIKTVTRAASDGFDAGDIPAVATSALGDLLPILSNLADVKAELDANPDSRAILAALLLNDILSLL